MNLEIKLTLTLKATILRGMGLRHDAIQTISAHGAWVRDATLLWCLFAARLPAPALFVYWWASQP